MLCFKSVYCNLHIFSILYHFTHYIKIYKDHVEFVLLDGNINFYYILWSRKIELSFIYFVNFEFHLTFIANLPRILLHLSIKN